VKVVLRGGTTGFAGIMADGAVKIVVNAPPVEGRANEALVRWLAAQFGAESVLIIAGRRSSRKTVRILRPTETPSWFHG